MLERVARLCYARRRLVLVVWIVALVVMSVAGNLFGGTLTNTFKLPGTESQRAFTLLHDRFPARSGDTGDIVFTAPGGIHVNAVQAPMQRLFAEVEKVPHVVSVTSPYGPRGSRAISTDGSVGDATIQFDKPGGDVPKSSISDIEDLVGRSRGANLTIELGGQMFMSQKQPASEVIGVAAAMIILLIAFGSLLAMGLPIITALFGIGIGLAIVNLLANVVTVPTFATQVAAMIAIGVGIDYALFIVTRYRDALHRGLDPESSVVEALTTAGRAVLFAGGTVVISLLGLFTIGLGFVRGLSLGASAAVLTTMLASVTLLPAVLGFVGHTIDRLRVGRRREGTHHRETVAFRWSRVLQAHPWPALLAGLIPLLVLAIPVFSLRMGVADAGNNPRSDTTRKAYDLLSKGFGPGSNGPILLAADAGSEQGLTTLDRLADTLRSVPGVASVSPPQPNPARNAAVINLVPTTSPQDVKTSDLLRHLRNDVVPQATRGTGVKIYVGGSTAIADDLTHQLSSRLPLFIGAVLVLSFLLLLAVFRSVLVPLKAVVMNLLSIGAAYGFIIAVFQWGWLKDVFGVGKSGPIESWIPMMMFAIVFGLSMDYEVFLLSRVREEYDRTHDNGLAVADGLATTARVITAAAAIMICVFASFALGDQRVLKMIGLGLASAVFIDATLVRMILVPATMELLGDRNWWFPHWLDRIVPRIEVEGSQLDRELGALLDEEAASRPGR